MQVTTVTPTGCEVVFCGGGGEKRGAPKWQAATAGSAALLEISAAHQRRRHVACILTHACVPSHA